MFCINVKEQFYVRFMINWALIFSRLQLNMFQARSVYHLIQVLAMLLFSVIIFHSTQEIGPFSLYRKKVMRLCIQTT